MSENFELVAPDKKTLISDQIQGTENTFSQRYQNVHYPFDNKEAYNEVVQNLTSYVSNLAELRLNKNFHNNLNFFERMGLVSQGKQEVHRRQVEMKKEVIVAGAIAASHALPYLYAWYQNRRIKREFLTNLVSWSGWIVGEGNFAYRNKIKKILEQNKSYNEKKVRSVFEQYASGELQKLPLFSDHIIKQPVEFFKTLVYLSDTKNPEQAERACALGKEGLGLRESQIEEYIRAGQGSQKDISDFISFNSNFITDYAGDLFNSLPQAAQFAHYMEINDPYRHGREARLEKLKSTGSKLAVGGVLGAITLTTGPLGDFIVASSGTLLFNLIGGDEVKKQLEFEKVYRGMLRDVKKIS